MPLRFPAARVVLVAAALLAGAPRAVAAPDFVEVAPETPYASGTRVGVTALGLSFEIPPDWIGRLPQGSEFLFLASHTEPGLVLVTAQKVTLEEAQRFLSQPLPLDAATIAQPAGQPAVDGQVVRQRYKVATGQGSMTGQAVAKLGAHGGIAFLAFGPDEGAAKALADRMLASVQEHAIPQPGETPTGPLATALRGKQLIYMKTQGDFSDKEEIQLCSDGRALLSTHSSGGSLTGTVYGSYVGSTRDQATWTVRGDQVLVISPDGSTRQWPVSVRDDGSIGVGRDNWWVRPQSVCP